MATATDKITFSSIAREMGVTTSVVSRVMRNTSTTISIGKETKKRILDLAWKRGYKLPRNVGLLAPDRKDIGLLYHPAATGVLERCAVLGVGIFSSHYKDDTPSPQIPEFLLKRQVGGVISFDCLPDAIREFLLEERIPFSVMNPHKNDLNEDSVLFDDYETMTNLLSHLQEKGYKKFIYASYDTQTLYSQRVLACLEDFMKSESLEGYSILSKSDREMEVIDQLQECVRATTPDTVFITPARLFTLKFIEFFAAQGKSAPKDGGIVGNNLLADYSIPKLTTVGYPFYDMGVAAVDMLVEKWERRIFNTPNRTIRGRIIINESTNKSGRRAVCAQHALT